MNSLVEEKSVVKVVSSDLNHSELKRDKTKNQNVEPELSSTGRDLGKPSISTRSYRQE